MKYSYIITHRSSCEYRHRNLLGIIKWLEPYKDLLEIIIVEQDLIPKAKKDLPDYVKYIFAYNPHVFHKTWGFNIGANHSSTNNLIFGDNDVIINRLDFEKYLNYVESCEFCSPYRKFVVKLDNEETCDVLVNLDKIKVPKNKEVPNTNGIITGGLFSIKKDIYFKIGGEDENFKGWGQKMMHSVRNYINLK